MLGFAPFKKHANRFNYTPRYYDPQKEAREQRRAELSGRRLEDADREYVPGQYIRTQREARAARRAQDARDGQLRMWKMVVGIALVLLFVGILYPRLADVFMRAQRQAPVAPQAEFGEFDPYAPITIVPNDYQEE